MSAEQVALARHRDHVGQVGDQAPGGVEVVDHGDLERAAGAGQAASAPGASTTSSAYVAPAGSPGQSPRSARVGVGAAEQQPGAAEVGVLEVVDRADGRADVGHGHGVRGRAQRRGDRRLVAGAHRSAARRPSPSSPDTSSLAASSAPAPSLRDRPSSRALLAGDQGGPLALGRLRLLAQLGQPGVDVREQGGSALVLGVEASLARVEAGDPGLERGELALCPLGSRARLPRALR